ncbi:methyltransferase domain-containing protein [candidate division KSB1 bacterium]|jgi:SAM-dependent methyltransferase|nr:methyltransferase domain-containing protein [candidate division KSB1 bacterium]
MDAIQKFWNEKEVVKRFANRDHDDRLEKFIHRFKSPSEVRILDLGCAGGRNTVFLAREGFDVWAVDFSQAMVKETRKRLFEMMGERVATRVVEGRMENLSWIPDKFFDIILALGLYHNAQSEEQLRVALKESSRILKPHGWLYSSSFMPGTVLRGQRLDPVPGHSFLYFGVDGDRACLLNAEQWDREMAKAGLFKSLPHEVAKGESDRSLRISLYSFYQKK